MSLRTLPKLILFLLALIGSGSVLAAPQYSVNSVFDTRPGVSPAYDVRAYSLKADYISLPGLTTYVSTGFVDGTGFTAAIANKNIVIPGAGIGGADYVGTVTAYVSPTRIDVSPDTTLALSDVTGHIGTDNGTLFNTLVNSTLTAGGKIGFAHGEFYVGNNVTVPAGIIAQFEPDAKLYLPANVTLRFLNPGSLNGNGRHQIFDGPGAKNVQIVGATVCPEWYGAKGDNTTDDSAAINAALSTLRATPYETVSGATLSATATSAVITASAGIFTAAILGKTLLVPGAGENGADLVSVIKTYSDSTHVTVVKTAGTSVSGKTGQSTGGGTLSLNPGSYYKTLDTLRPAAIYDAAIDILNATIDNLTIEGNGAHIVNAGGDSVTSGTTNTNVFSTLIALGSNVTIRGAHFDHTHVFDTTSVARPFGITDPGYADLRVTADKNGIEGNTLWVGGTYGDAATLGTHPYGSASNIKIVDCTSDGAWYTHIRPIWASNVTIDNFHGQHSCATAIFPGHPGNHYVVKNSTIETSEDDAIYFSGNGGADSVSDVQIINCSSINNQGRIGFGGVKNGWIDHCYIENSNAPGISLENQGSPLQENHSIHITNNILKNCGRNWGTGLYFETNGFAGPAIYSSTSNTLDILTDLEIAGNEIYNSYKAPIHIDGANRLNIHDNKINGTGDLGTSFYSNGIEIGLNPATSKKNCENVSIQNNTLVGVTSTAIFAAYSTTGTIGGNTISAYGITGTLTNYAIQAYVCDRFSIHPNTINNSNAVGFTDGTGSVNTIFETGNAYQGTAAFGDTSPAFGPYNVFNVFRQFYALSAPASSTTGAGTYNVGDKFFNSAPTSALRSSSVATVAGTAGTLFDAYGTGVTTGSMTITENKLAVGLTTGLSVGQVLLIGGETAFGKISAIAASATKTGTLSSTGTAVTGSGTTFLTQLSVGDYITASSQTRQVTAIADDTHLTTLTAFSPTLSGATWIKAAVLTVTNVDATAYSASATVSGAALSGLVVGTITNASPTLTVNDATNLRLGQWVRVAGAGAAGGNLDARINAISGVTVTLSVNASTTLTTAGWVAYKAPTWDDGTGALNTVPNGKGVGIDPIWTGNLGLSGGVTVSDQNAANSMTGVAYLNSSVDSTSGFGVQKDGTGLIAWPAIIRAGKVSTVWTSLPGATGGNFMNIFPPDASSLTGTALNTFSALGASYPGVGAFAPSSGVMYNYGTLGGFNIGAADGTDGVGLYAGGSGTSNLHAQVTTSGLKLPDLTASTLLYGNASKFVSSVTMGSGLSLSGGTLSNTGVLTLSGEDLATITGRGNTTTSSIQAASFTLGSSGPTITAGSGAPASSPPTGSLYLNTAGANGFNLYVRDSGSAWKTALVGQYSNVDINFTSIAANTTSESTGTATGALAGDQVIVTSNDGLESGLMVNAWVSATNTITVRVANVTTGAIDPADHVFTFTVIRHN